MDKDWLIFVGTLPWVFFLMVVLLCDSSNGRKQKKLVGLFLFAFIFAAIRYGIGYDYYSYKHVIDGNSYDYELERLEILPRYLAIISGKIHFQIFFAVCSFLTIYPVYFVSRKLSINPLKSFVVYLLFPLFFLEGLGVIRNAVAYSLVLLMFYYISKKRYFYSLLLWGLSIGFHSSAIVAVLLYPLFFSFHKRSLHFVLYLFSFMLAVYIMPILISIAPNIPVATKVLSNVDKEMASTGGLLFYVVNGIAIFHFLCWNKLLIADQRNKIYLSLVNVGICFWNVFLSLDPTTAQRLSLFFLLFLILVAPYYKYISIRNRAFIKKSMTAILVLLFVSSLGLNLYAYYFRGRNMSNIPYQVFFLNPSDVFLHIN